MCHEHRFAAAAASDAGTEGPRSPPRKGDWPRRAIELLRLTGACARAVSRRVGRAR